MVLSGFVSFSDVVSGSLSALLAANQKLHLKIVVGYPCFYPRKTLVALTPGQPQWHWRTLVFT